MSTMEVIIGLLVLIVVVAVLITVLSPKDTKLFRRIWSAEKAGIFEAKRKACDELYERFGVQIPDSSQEADMDRLGSSIGRLMESATEFDLKHRHNLGVLVTNALARDLDFRLAAAGIKDFKVPLSMMESVDIVRLAEAMEKTMKEL